MKVWILYDTQFGNGKKLAEAFKEHFPTEYEVKTGDVKDVSPSSVAQDKPDVLILGGAIRMFRGAPKSKKWVKNLNSELKNLDYKVKYAGAYLTHGLATDKIQGHGKRFLKKLQKASMIENTHSELLTAQVEEQEGPIKKEEIQKAQKYMQDFINWLK
jgi:flavodoxin